MLWAGSVALLPLTVLIIAQLLWLDDLRESEELARRAILGDYLRSLDAEMERYVASFDTALDLSPELLCPLDPAAVAERLGRSELVGVSRVALVTWCAGERRVFIDPADGSISSPASAAEGEAVDEAFEVWQASTEAFVEVEGTGVVVDENAAERRLIIRPVKRPRAGREASPPGEVVGLVAAVVDLNGLREEVLPRLAARRVVVDGEHVIGVTIRDAEGALLWASDPSKDPNNDEIVEEFSLLYPDVTVGVGLQATSAAELAKANFTLNVILALALGGALLGGVALLLRIAARERQLSELKSDFVANVSHELKTPIASIQLFAELLRDGRAKDPEKVREYGGLIDKESRRLTRLVDTVLDLARFESGAGVVREDDVQIEEVIAQLVERVAGREGNGARLRVAFPEEPLPPMSVDRAALDRAVGNLVSNALKYSDAEARVDVRLELRGDEVHIEVEDRGVGVPEAERERIFERFHRLQRGPVHDVKGAGLGLAITHFIVEAHGGRLRVDSELGRGSTFAIILPTGRSARGHARRTT